MIASKVEDITYHWSRDAGTGDEYGLLAVLLGVDEYDHQTGISSYVEETEPDTYDGTIDDTTPTHTQKHKEEEWECLRTCWYICKGFLKGVTANLCDAIDEQFYSQLKHRHTAYHNTTPFQIMEHLNSTWCPLDVKAKKETQGCLLCAMGPPQAPYCVRQNITISYEDKLQFYFKQMYRSNMFDKAEMMEWEQQPINIKTDYDLVKNHFELKVKAHDTYIQNSSSGAAGCNKYESANNMADIGDEIKDYIVKMASASITNNDIVANMRGADKKKDAEMAEMSAQIKQLTAAIAKLASRGQQNTENNDPNKKRGRRGGIVEQMTKPRNMGGYCSTHGFHPVGLTHNSVTCQFKKKDEHNDAAT